MSDTPIDGAPLPGPRRLSTLERESRLWSGLVLFAFVATHLINHAIGIAGLHWMTLAQTWHLAVWDSPPGTVLLYGAFTVHLVLVLKRLARRRAVHMPIDEAVQILLGLLIPYLLIDHVIATRIAHAMIGSNLDYGSLLPAIWDGKAVAQSVLLCFAWIHGCIGVTQSLRTRESYRRWRRLWSAFVVLVPALALAGFTVAAREAVLLQLADGYDRDYSAYAGPGAAALADAQARLQAIGRDAHLAFFLALGAVCAFAVAREVNLRRGGAVTVRYVGHGEVKVTRGTTVLEASRIAGIPHPALCGGRGRCSTCRIAVSEGLDDLPPPNGIEGPMLRRLAAPANVRLACQLRPMHDISAQILLPILPRTERQQVLDEAYRWGAERRVSVLFVDIRAFNGLTRRLTPYDMTVLINLFIKEMSQVAEAHGGRVDSFMTDRLMAVFGLVERSGAGARDAIAAAKAMLAAVDDINEKHGAALPFPLRIGIGIHTGDAVVTVIGDSARGLLLTAMGDTVTIASQLEAATKDLLVDCLVSGETVKASGLNLPRHETKSLMVGDLDAPIAIHRLDGLPG